MALSLKEENPSILTYSAGFFKKWPGNKRSETAIGNTFIPTVSLLI